MSPAYPEIEATRSDPVVLLHKCHAHAIRENLSEAREWALFWILSKLLDSAGRLSNSQQC